MTALRFDPCPFAATPSSWVHWRPSQSQVLQLRDRAGGALPSDITRIRASMFRTIRDTSPGRSCRVRGSTSRISRQLRAPTTSTDGSGSIGGPPGPLESSEAPTIFSGSAAAGEHKRCISCALCRLTLQHFRRPSISSFPETAAPVLRGRKSTGSCAIFYVSWKRATGSVLFSISRAASTDTIGSARPSSVPCGSEASTRSPASGLGRGPSGRRRTSAGSTE